MSTSINGLNERSVWEAVVSGDPARWIAGLPDEFQGWARSVAERIIGGVAAEEQRIESEFWRVCKSFGSGFSRKEFALAVKDSPDKWAMFACLDGRLIGPEILKRAKPAANIFPSNLRCQSEDVA